MPDQQTPDSDELELDKLLFDCISAIGTREGGTVIDLDTLIIDRQKAVAALLAWADRCAEQQVREALDDFTDNWLGRLLAENSIPNHWIYEARDKYLAQLTRPEAEGGKE